ADQAARLPDVDRLGVHADPAAAPAAEVIAGDTPVAPDLETARAVERGEEAIQDPQLFGLLERLAGQLDLPGSVGHASLYWEYPRTFSLRKSFRLLVGTPRNVGRQSMSHWLQGTRHCTSRACIFLRSSAIAGPFHTSRRLCRFRSPRYSSPYQSCGHGVT